MQLTLIGTNPAAESAVEAVCLSGLVERVDLLPEQAERSHLVVLAVAGPEIGSQAAPLIRRGFHVFFPGPPSPTLRDASALLRLAEEAGVEVGLARTLRFVPSVLALLQGGRAMVCQVTIRLPYSVRDRLIRVVADAADLAIAATGSGSPQRVDAEVVRDSKRQPLGLGASIRFQSGALAQLMVTLGAPHAEAHLTSIAGGDDSGVRTADFDPFPSDSEVTNSRVIGLQTFVSAVLEGRPPPVSLADGVLAMRVAERIHAAAR